MKSLLVSLLVLILIPAGAFAQNSKTDPLPPQVQPRREVLPGQPVVPPRTKTRGATNSTNRPALGAPSQQELTSNITLTLQGSLLGSVDLDLQLTGSGPQFTTDLPGPPNDDKAIPGPILSISAVVTQSRDGYRVQYSLGARVAMPTSTMQAPGGKTIQNIEFRDMSLGGTAIVKAGEAVTISKVNGKTLTLSISVPE